MRLSVKFAVSLDIASKGPDLRGNLQNTIGFADSQTEKKNCKNLHSNSAGTRLYRFADLFPFANLAILITSLPLFFNRSLEEGKIGYMAIRDARFTYTVHL